MLIFISLVKLGNLTYNQAFFKIVISDFRNKSGLSAYVFEVIS